MERTLLGLRLNGDVHSILLLIDQKDFLGKWTGRNLLIQRSACKVLFWICKRYKSSLKAHRSPGVRASEFLAASQPAQNSKSTKCSVEKVARKSFHPSRKKMLHRQKSARKEDFGFIFI